MPRSIAKFGGLLPPWPVGEARILGISTPLPAWRCCVKIQAEIKWLRTQTKRLNREVLQLQRQLAILQLALLGVKRG
jgi:hypothetical protein